MPKKKAVKKEEKTAALAVKPSAVVGEWQKVESILTPENVKKYLCPNASDVDLFMFGQFCRKNQVDPFSREAYLIKYSSDSPASIVTAKEAFFKRADNCKAYDGLSSGTIIKQGTQVIFHTGALVVPGETLIGGWAEVGRKDRKHPFRSETMLSEYDKKQSQWKVMPATMIVKVAEVQALRKAFPNVLSELYIPEEMPTITQELPAAPVKVLEVVAEKQQAAPVGTAQEQPVATNGTLVHNIAELVTGIGCTAPFSIVSAKEEKPPERARDVHPPESQPPDASGPATAFRLQQIAALVGALPLEDRDTFVSLLQKKVGIPADKKPKDFTNDEAVRMVTILKKQISEEPEKKTEQKPSEIVNAALACSDCGREMKKEHTSYKYSMKRFGCAVCFVCGKKRNAK